MKNKNKKTRSAYFKEISKEVLKMKKKRDVKELKKCKEIFTCSMQLMTVSSVCLFTISSGFKACIHCMVQIQGRQQHFFIIYHGDSEKKGWSRCLMSLSSHSNASHHTLCPSIFFSAGATILVPLERKDRLFNLRHSQ